MSSKSREAAWLEWMGVHDTGINPRPIPGAMIAALKEVFDAGYAACEQGLREQIAAQIFNTGATALGVYTDDYQNGLLHARSIVLTGETTHPARLQKCCPRCFHHPDMHWPEHERDTTACALCMDHQYYTRNVGLETGYGICCNTAESISGGLNHDEETDDPRETSKNL